MVDLKQDFYHAIGNDYRGEALFGEIMKKYTALGIGGPADIYVVPADAMSLKRCIKFARDNNIEVFVLGGGTNTLLPDDGFRGMVISLKHFNMIKVVNDKREVAELFVEAGMLLQRLIHFCAENGYSGLECLAGIPGTVGGAIIGNSGSFGQEMKDVVVSLIVINLMGMIKTLQGGEFLLSYRKSQLPEDSIVLGSHMLFKKNDPEAVKKTFTECLKKKKDTQPLSFRSAGCVFKNPEGESAGRLIEAAGCKGMRVGDIEVSDIHANYFINKGVGTSFDFLDLMDIVREKVAEKTGIVLEPEIRFVQNGH